MRPNFNHSVLQVNSPSTTAITISWCAGFRARFTTSKSPSKRPASRIESPRRRRKNVAWGCETKMAVKSRRSTWKSSAGEGNPARTQSPSTGRIRGEGSQGTGIAHILTFYTAPRILVTKPPRATTSASPWRSFDTPNALPFCSAKHSGVNSLDAEQRPPERGAICNPTTCEASKTGGF